MADMSLAVVTWNGYCLTSPGGLSLSHKTASPSQSPAILWLVTRYNDHPCLRLQCFHRDLKTRATYQPTITNRQLDTLASQSPSGIFRSGFQLLIRWLPAGLSRSHLPSQQSFLHQHVVVSELLFPVSYFTHLLALVSWQRLCLSCYLPTHAVPQGLLFKHT